MDWQLTYLTPDAAQEFLDDPSVVSDTALAALDWRPAEVPGSVQTSAFGMLLPDLYVGDNVQRVAWMGGVYWIYRSTFVMPAVAPDEEATLVFVGIDYQAAIYLNGRKVCDHEGMFSPVAVSLEGLVTGSVNDLLVVITPFVAGPEPHEHMKSRVGIGNGWDFAPRLVTAGIWDVVRLEVRPRLRVLGTYVHTTLANQQRADNIVYIDLSELVEYGTLILTLDTTTRRYPVVQTDHLALPLEVLSPRLWWPNGHGAPTLVTLRIELDVPGRATRPFVQRVGLRSIDRVPCAGQGVEDTPLQLRINGRPIFLKGVNWTPLDACPGSITPERYRTFLEQFRAAGVNMIRVWGGGLKEKDAFYTLADEFGLMVMQEFPLACQRLARTERFFRLVAQEVTSIVRALRHHACIVLWSGGNEHYHYWASVDSGTPIMERVKATVQREFDIDPADPEWHGFADTYDEPALSLMGSLCAALDRSRPYQITSALEGEGEAHGIWTWNPRVGDYRYRDYDSLYDFWNAARRHLYSEASVPSIANLDSIRFVCGAEYKDCPQPDDSLWLLHNAFRAAWDGPDDVWLDLTSIEKLFGKLESLDALVFASQWMQAEGARYLIEAVRRRTGHTSGVLWWGVNEIWTALAGSSLIDYFGQPKLAWSFVANAFKPSILTLRYENCVCRSAKPELWLCHDGPDRFQGSYQVTLHDLQYDQREVVEGRLEAAPYSAFSIRTLPRRRLVAGGRLHIQCRLLAPGGEPVHINDYVFASNEDAPPFDATMRAYLQQLFSPAVPEQQTIRSNS
ncbi:MAG: hypothetical protein IT323_11535 [Anaerolineae bacterium]|nr:hypothetical protein [Anaerolineae bacterium]